MKNPTLSELRKQAERDQRRMPPWRRRLIWGVSLLAAWAVLGFLVAPPLLRTQLEQRLTAELHRTVKVGQVRLNPFTLSLTLENFSVAGPKGGIFLAWRRLHVNLQTLPLVMREIRFKTIELDAFNAAISVSPDGRLNFADLLERPAAAPAKKPSADKPWALRVNRLEIKNARLVYHDASRAESFHTEIGPTGVRLLNFRIGGPGQAPGEFAAVTESGETFAWRGTLSLAPLRSDGQIALGKIALRKYAPYYGGLVRFDVLDGLLDVSGQYRFALENDRPALRLSGGTVTLASLQLARRGATEPVVTLQRLGLTGIAADLPARSFEATRLEIAGGSVALRRDASGIDLVELLAPPAAPAPPAVAPAPTVALPGSPAAPAATPPPAAPPMKAELAELAVRDLAVTIEDRSTPRPAHIGLTGLTFDLREFSLAEPAHPMPFGVRVGVGTDALIHAAGTVALSPLKADCTLEINALPLATFSPYAESFVNARIARGALTSAAHLSLELPADGSAPVVAAQGEAAVAAFSMTGPDSDDVMFAWEKFELKGLDYSTNPARLTIADIEWVEPAVHLIVGADGALNLSAALAPRTAGAPPAVSLPPAPVSGGAKPSAAAPAGEPLFIALDHFGLQDASLEFVDRTVAPQVRTVIGQLTGSIDGLASSELARATVDLRGKVDGIAPVVITGKINPLAADAYTDLKMNLRNVGLAPVGPYLGKYVGRELERGTLTVDVKCRVNRRKMDSANVATLDQFTLGKETGSPDATRLPVSLAIALLRDTSGRIVLDVPVQGSLDDPNFRIGRVVLRVIVNLLTKAATSPFSLLGAMFGGGGDELAWQQFSPGEAVLLETEIKKLETVAKALSERPALRLEIAGACEEATDGPVLREQALELEMRRLIWMDRSLVDPSLSIEDVQLDPLQKKGMIRRLYYKTFPKEKPKHVTFTKSEPPPPVAGQRGNLGAFKRTVTTTSATSAPKLPPPRPAGAGDKKDDPDDASDPLPKLPEAGQPTPFDAMKERLLAGITVEPESYRQLATARAEAVRDWLVKQGHIAPERIAIANPETVSTQAAAPRAELILK